MTRAKTTTWRRALAWSVQTSCCSSCWRRTSLRSVQVAPPTHRSVDFSRSKRRARSLPPVHCRRILCWRVLASVTPVPRAPPPLRQGSAARWVAALSAGSGRVSSRTTEPAEKDLNSSSSNHLWCTRPWAFQMHPPPPPLRYLKCVRWKLGENRSEKDPKRTGGVALWTRHRHLGF